MKKAFLLLCLAFALFVNAENIIQVTPCTIESGYTKNNYDQSHMFSIEMTNDIVGADGITGIQFDMYLPEGLNVLADVELNPDRFEGRTVKNVWQPNAAVELVKQGEGHYLFLLYHTNLETVSGTEGTIISFYYETTEEFNNKLCPIVLKNIVLKPVEGAKVEVASSTSYIKVGNPTDVTLEMEGVIPSFVNTALATETAITTLDLTNVTASNGTFTYVPGRVVKAPEAEVKGNVTATVAPKTGSTYASVCMPFAADIHCYTYEGVEGEFACFTSKTALDANTPALIDESVTATAENVVLGATTDEIRTSGYYVKGDKFCKVTGSATIPALRGWWNIPNEVRGMVVEGEETAIGNVNDEGENIIYNVAGIRLSKAQRGVNIVGGKKVILK